MLDFLGRWFRRSPEEDFRRRVLTLLAELFPGQKFSAGDGPDVVSWSGGQCHLANLRAQLRLLEATPEQERDLIRDHFQASFRSAEDLTVNSWEDVRHRVKPQLGTAQILEQLPLAHMPLGENLVKLMVVDAPSAFRYVSAEDLFIWKVTWEELEITATENLNDACAGKTELNFIPGPDRVVAVQTMDGFDAARILIPDFRAFVAGKLGAPFLFGAPNRDFLICWSHDNSESFLKMTSARLRHDHARMPYPISPHIFEASRSGIRPWNP